jgi:hypothetical protein
MISKSVNVIDTKLAGFINELSRFCEVYPDSSSYIKYFLRFLQNVQDLEQVKLLEFSRKEFYQDKQKFATSQILAEVLKANNEDYKAHLGRLLTLAVSLTKTIKANLPLDYDQIEKIENFKISTVENWVIIFISNIQNITNNKPASVEMVKNLNDSWNQLTKTIESMSVQASA